MTVKALAATKAALTAATKAFMANPSATNWCEMHRAMENHQATHYSVKEAMMYAKAVEAGCVAKY
jgi:hypothetical protein